MSKFDYSFTIQVLHNKNLHPHVKTSKAIQSTHELTPLIAFTLESLLRHSKALLIGTTLHQHPDYIHPFRFLDFSRLPIPSFAEASLARERRIYGKCKVEIMQSFVSTNPSIQTQSVADRNKTFLYPVPFWKRHDDSVKQMALLWLAEHGVFLTFYIFQ